MVLHTPVFFFPLLQTFPVLLYALSLLCLVSFHKINQVFHKTIPEHLLQYFHKPKRMQVLLHLHYLFSFPLFYLSMEQLNAYQLFLFFQAHLLNALLIYSNHHVSNLQYLQHAFLLLKDDLIPFLQEAIRPLLSHHQNDFHLI